MSLDFGYLSNMFEQFCQIFILGSKTFAKKSILSANKFIPLKAIYALYVRVSTAMSNIVISNYLE